MGRGRPRKYPVKEVEEDFAPVKRGRGRPKKNRTIEPDNSVVLSGDVEVLCEDGSNFVSTPNHKIVDVKENTWKQVSDLTTGDTVVGSDGQSHMISDIVYLEGDISVSSTYGTSQYTQGMKQVCDCGNDCGNDCRCDVQEVKRGRGRPKKNSTIEPTIHVIQSELADMEFESLETVMEPLSAGVFINESDNIKVPTAMYGKKVYICPRCKKNPVLNFQDWLIEKFSDICICAECAK